MPRIRLAAAALAVAAALIAPAAASAATPVTAQTIQIDRANVLAARQQVDALQTAIRTVSADIQARDMQINVLQVQSQALLANPFTVSAAVPIQVQIGQL